jgi:hypothetical protein
MADPDDRRLVSGFLRGFQNQVQDWLETIDGVEAALDNVDDVETCRPRRRHLVNRINEMRELTVDGKIVLTKIGVFLDHGKWVLNDFQRLITCVLTNPRQLQRRLSLPDIQPGLTQRLVDTLNQLVVALTALHNSTPPSEENNVRQKISVLKTRVNDELLRLAGEDADEDAEGKVNGFIDESNTLKRESAELVEDKSNAVRVYVRSRPDKGSEILTMGNSTVNVDGNHYGPFYNTYDESFRLNGDVFYGKGGVCEDSNVCSVIKYLDNRDILIGAYGLSGTGKTSLMVGRGGDRGIIELSKEYFSTYFPGKSLRLKYIFEEAYNETADDVKSSTFCELNLKGKIIVLYDVDNDFKSLIEGCTYNTLELDPENIGACMATVNDHRKKMKRIVETSNNPESSRSHLFIVYGTDSGTYLTFMDMAGKETPQQMIVNTIYDDKDEYGDYVIKFTEAVRTNTSTFIRQFLRKSVGKLSEDLLERLFKSVDKQVKGVKEGSLQGSVLKEGIIKMYKNLLRLVKEGVYINSGLVDFKLFCQERAGRDKTGKRGVTNAERWTTSDSISSKDKSLMNSVLRQLTSRPGSKPSKLVLMALVRGEVQYTTDTKETLKMCDGISSTNISAAEAAGEGEAGGAAAGEAGEAGEAAGGAYRFVF